MKDSISIRDLPLSERPRERLFKYGTSVLSNSELLAIILRTGSKNEGVISLCNRILIEAEGIGGLFNLAPEELMKIGGVGKAKASQLLALQEIAKRFGSFKSGDEYKINSPSDAAKMLMEDMRYLNEEHLKVVMLNTKNIVLSVKDVSIGSLNSSIVHPREVFTEAIKRGCASIIVCHNHPSGDPTPSKEDIDVTHRLNESSKILGIDLLDHLIIGNGKYESLKERGIL